MTKILNGMLALGLGCGWMLVGLEKYCQCKLKGPQEAMNKGYDNDESSI